MFAKASPSSNGRCKGMSDKKFKTAWPLKPGQEGVLVRHDHSYLSTAFKLQMAEQFGTTRMRSDPVMELRNIM